MKNLLFLKGILAFVFALAFQISYAQLQNNHVNKGAVIKPIKNITNVEYKTLKKQGALSDQYEYIIDHGANMPVASYSINLAKSTTILTQCDPLPVQGSIGYSVETDDTPLLTIPIPFNFCFYGTNYTSLRLSANGNVQFSTNSTAFSSTGFPSSTVNMIAPFWADGESMVSSGGITYGKIYIDPHPTYMIISWDSMGYFNNMVDKLNSFQLVLTNGLDPILPVGKNVGFYYKKMQWTTGGASGGTNGFPTTQPGTPATIGANQGNGIDYFLIGRFGVPGSVYDGPLGNSDGISWLDGKRFFFDVCPPIGTNQSPVSTLIGPCDTIKVCGNDSLIIKNAFIGPELTQSVSITASAPSLGSSFSFTTITTGNSTDINMMVDGSSAPAGYHTVTMSATDNGTPSLTSSQTFLVFVDRTSTNNLNGQIIITPTIGICPGGAASASILTTGGTPSSYLWSDNSAGTSTNFTVTPSLDSTVFVTLKFGQCQKTIKNYIHVKPVPVASITGNTSLCSGTNSTTVLTASNTLNSAAQAPYTYTWAGSPAPSPTNTQTTTASGGTYSVTITNKYNCSASTVITVNLATTPMFTVVPTNTTICSNGAVPLSLTFGNGAPACGLSTSGGCTSPNNIQVGSATTQGSGSVYTPYGGLFESARNQYLFRASELIAAGISPGKIDKLAFNVTNLNGNANSFENFTIKIKCVTYSVVSTTSMDNTGLIQVYGPQTINASVGWNTYNFTQAYEWDGVSNLLVDICFFNQNWDGNISVQYTNVGFTSTKYVNADNNDQCPVTTVDGTDVNRPNVRFGNCPSTPAASAFTYSWSPATGLSSTSVSNPTANISASIQYSVIVTPTAAPTCSNVGTTSLTIITPATPTITAVSALCSNAPNFTLTGLPTGGTWSLTASTSTAGVFTPSLAAIGNNTVTYLYGGAGCLQTTTAIVPIERYVPSTITGTINPICLPGSTVNLSTALTTSTLGVGTWSGNGVTGTTFNPISAGVGTHTLTYSTNSVPTIALCPTFSTIAVTVNSAIQPTISAIGPFCTNTPSVVISASPTGGTWAASPGVNTAGAFTPSLALIGNNTYTYTVGASACSATNTITIAVEQFVPSTITGAINALCITNQPINLSTALGTSPLGVGVWSGNGVTGAMFDPNVAGAGTHTLTYSTNSVPTTALCPDASTIEVTVNSVVQPTITATGPFCDNFTAQQLVANPNGGVWSAGTIGTNVSTAGLLSPGSSLLGPNKILYTLTNAPCVKQDSINVTIIHFIPATITGALGPYCNYDAPVNLQPTAQFTGGVWSGAGVNGSSFNPTTAGAGVHPITYSTDPAPGTLCGDSKTLTIVVNPKPEANAVPDATVGCNPVTINYSTNTVNTGTAIWDFGDGSPRETGLIFTHIYSSPGTYTATLYYTDLNGCKDTTTAVNGITVNALPVASFNPSLIQTTVIDGQVEFTNQSTVLGNNTYEWNIGDGMYTSNNINESYLFSNSGNFVVTLFATTAEGCVDDTSLVIVVNPDVVLYVPNAFTPGVDGLNDVFQIFLPPSGVDYSTFHLTIFNRWGELIYQTNDVNESWTGAKNNSGPILKQDTYIYKIEFQDERKKHYEKTGHVSLLRK